MGRRFTLLATLGSLLWMMGCATAPPPPPLAPSPEAGIKELKDTEVAWNAAWVAKDLEKILAQYADDITMMMPDMPGIHGKAAVRTALTEMMKDPGASLTFTSSVVDVSKSGDIGYAQGTYTETSTNPKTKKVVTEKGKYLTIYKKQADGKWLAVEDINNADAPAK